MAYAVVARKTEMYLLKTVVLDMNAKICLQLKHVLQ